MFGPWSDKIPWPPSDEEINSLQPPAAQRCTWGSPHVQHSAINCAKGPMFCTFYLLTLSQYTYSSAKRFHWFFTVFGRGLKQRCLKERSQYLVTVPVSNLGDIWVPFVTSQRANCPIMIGFAVLLHTLFWKENKVPQELLIAEQLIDNVSNGEW